MITPRVSRLFAFAASRKSLELRGVRALRPLLCSSSIDLSHTIGVMLFRSLFLVACFTVRIVAGAQEIQVVNAGIPGENSAEVKARFHNALKASHPSFVIIYVGMNDAVNDRKFLPIAASTVLCIGDSLTFGIGVRPVGASERRTENYLYPTYPAQLAEGISGAALK